MARSTKGARAAAAGGKGYLQRVGKRSYLVRPDGSRVKQSLPKGSKGKGAGGGGG